MSPKQKQAPLIQSNAKIDVSPPQPNSDTSKPNVAIT